MVYLKNFTFPNKDMEFDFLLEIKCYKEESLYAKM